MTDTRPITVRIFACPDVSGEWLAVCPDLDVVTHGRSRVDAAEMFADALRTIEEHDSDRGDDPFARASLSDDTVGVYAALLRDVTAALRRATGKAASPEACAMLREALDDLDDALENHELAHTVGPLLDEAKATLASDVHWRPFLLRVAPEWVPPDGCKITSRLGDIVGCTLAPAALAACEADPAVLIAEESTGECHNGTEEA